MDISQVVLDRLLYMLLNGASDGDCIEYAAEIGFKFTESYVCLVFLNRRQLCYSNKIYNEFYKLSNDGLNIMINHRGYGKYAVCLCGSYRKVKNKLQTVLTDFLNSNPDFYVSIGPMVPDFFLTKEGFKKAGNIIDWSFYRPENKVIIHNEVEQLTEYLGFGDKFLDSVLLWGVNLETSLHVVKGTYNDCPFYVEDLQKRRALICIKSIIAIRNDLLLSLKRFQSMEELHNHIYSVETFDELTDLVMSILNIFILYINDSGRFSPIIRQFIKYVSNNYGNPSLNVAKICESLHFSNTYLNNALLRETGDTINRYITKYRINAAKFILTNSNDTIKDIAKKCGFTDAAYFARTFKKYEKVTPFEYKKQNIQKSL